MSQARSGTPDEGGAAAGDALADPARLRALEQTGLGAEPDEEMDFYADWVRRALDVPVALVTLVRADRQVYPGMAGLPEPWATARAMPLRHAPCRYVVTTAAPLTIDDARGHPLVRDSLAVTELGLVAYAGVPLADDAGNVLGSLCAIDTVPRAWAEGQLATLRDLARACATALRLRLTRHDAGRDGDRRDESEEAQRRAYDRSQTLLRASQAFSDTRTVDDVRGRIGELVDTELRPTDLLTIAGYAGQALDRARLLHHRISVAHELQAAMLTTLPAVDGLAMAARYEPADSRENVGGDWFDAAPVQDLADPRTQVVAVSVGDVVGHTLRAATVMGQVRSMLRQSAWDHPTGPPSLVLGAFEAAERGLDLGAAGSAVVAQLCRPLDGRWSMTWTNAGHPPPVLLLPDGTTELLTDHDALFGFRLTASLPRRDQRRDLAPGSTLFLYTDGLVERRDSDVDAGIDALLALLDEVRDRAPQEIVDAAVTRLAPDADDDVVAFAIHFPRDPS